MPGTSVWILSCRLRLKFAWAILREYRLDFTGLERGREGDHPVVGLVVIVVRGSVEICSLYTRIPGETSDRFV